MKIWLAGKEDVFKGTDYVNVSSEDFVNSQKFNNSDIVIFTNANFAILVKSRNGLSLKEVLIYNGVGGNDIRAC